MNFDDGLQKKSVHKRGGEEIFSTFPRKELVTKLTGMQLECGGGEGKEGRARETARKMEYKIKFPLQGGRKKNIEKRKT